MNICYFSNQFASASGHGIAHYAHRIFDGLRSHADLNVIPTATWSDRSAAELERLRKESGLKLLPWGRQLTPLAWTYLNGPPIERWLDMPVDIMHMVAPGFPVATRKKLVVTVHDMGPITHPEYFVDSKPWLFRRGIAQTVRQADAIICVSQATADELVGYAGESISKRIHVIHEGVDADFFGENLRPEVGGLRPEVRRWTENGSRTRSEAGAEQRQRSGNSEVGCRLSVDGGSSELEGLSTKNQEPATKVPYFLAAGAMSPRKNIKRVLEAFRNVMDVIPHHVVLVGGGGWDSAEVFDSLESSELSRRVHHLGYVSDDELQSLYKAADFYVQPSLFEGFGLTILEAMAAGCPVITSNTTSLPEVAGDAALLVDPTSVDEIGAAIQQLALNDSLRHEYRNKGLGHVQKFQWSETARRVAEVYRSL